MNAKIKFYKYSGNGNDFIILDNPQFPLTKEVVVAMCSRHFGIGADGILLINSEEGADAHMRIFNADGGEAEMCGNGIRCVAAFLDDRINPRKDSYRIRSMNSSYDVKRINNSLAVEMSEIKDKNKYDLSLFKQFRHSFYVNTGVPHLVLEVPQLKKIDIKSIAPQFRHHKMFPNGTNVNFIEVIEGHQTAYVRTFERGVEDETFSCGTGLTASGLALNQWYNWNGGITLKTLGGTQHITLGEKVYYSGEVKFCFSGEYAL